MKKITLARAMSVLLLFPVFIEANEKPMSTCDFKTAMRELWNDHGVWTREYIVNALSDSPAAKASAKRLMKNQEDIGKGIAPFYGDEAGRKLTDLLKEHISIAVDLIEAAKKSDKKEMDRISKCWENNAYNISVFLSKANPHINKEDTFNMMKDHLSVTSKEIPLRLKKQWDKEAPNYDAVRKQLNAMADALAQAIIKQFPDKFE